MSNQIATAHVELNQEEGKNLLALIDIAIKAQGLNAAEAGLHLAKKINAAFTPPKETNVLQQLPE
jgi:hypothetical protein